MKIYEHETEYWMKIQCTYRLKICISSQNIFKIKIIIYKFSQNNSKVPVVRPLRFKIMHYLAIKKIKAYKH